MPQPQPFEQIDIYGSLQPMVDGGAWFWRADVPKLDRRQAAHEPRTPWVYHHPDFGADCHFQNEVLFKRFGLMPSYCMECYKVLIVPNTVDQLFKLCDVQTQLRGLPSKCGLEVRDETDRNYGGYHYNRGLDMGRECYGLMRQLVDKHVGTHVRVALKRACTEFERRFGQSDKWPEITDEQIAFEQRVYDMIVPPPKIIEQPPDLVKHIKNNWVKFAHARGDMSYLNYTNGVPLYEPYVLYAGEL